jgi:tetratricopeptide (TPR) repeat protein
MSGLARLLQALLLAVLLLACAAALHVIIPAAWGDAMFMRTRWLIGQWTSGEAPQPGIAAWGKAQKQVEYALQVTPDDPNLHESLAWLYASRSQAMENYIPELATEFMQKALVSYQQAATLRPMSAPTWANVALAHHKLATSGTEDLTPMWTAFDKALAYGAREPVVQKALAEVGFARFDAMTPERRQAFLAMVGAALTYSLPPIAAQAVRHGHWAEFSAAREAAGQDDPTP